MKSLRMLTLRIKIIKTRPKRKNSMKKVLEDLIKVKGSSIELKVSKLGQEWIDAKLGRPNLKKIGIIQLILLGEKLGTTDEI